MANHSEKQVDVSGGPNLKNPGQPSAVTAIEWQQTGQFGQIEIGPPPGATDAQPGKPNVK